MPLQLFNQHRYALTEGFYIQHLSTKIGAFYIYTIFLSTGGGRLAKYDDELIKQMKQEGKTWVEIGEKLKVNSETLRTHARKQDWYKDIKEADPHVVEEGMEYSTTEQGVYQIDKEFLFDEERLFSNDELLRMNNLDPDEFELLRIRRGKWSVTIRDGQRKWNFQRFSAFYVRS